MLKNKLSIANLLIIVVMLFISATANGKESVVGMSQKVYKVLNQAQILYEQGDGVSALAQLSKARSDYNKRLSDYENAHILNMMAAIQQDRGNTEIALSLFEEAVSYPKLPATQKSRFYKNIAQLSIMTEHYDKALDYIRKAIDSSLNPDAGIYVLAAQALYYLERFDDARKDIDHAINLDRKMTNKKGSLIERPPRESWLQLANAIYYSQKDYQAMLEVHHQLLLFYPSDQYLLNLAVIYGELEQSEKQLALMESVFEGGYIDDGNKIMNLANLFLIHEIPYKAAVLIEAAIDEEKIEKNVSSLDRLGQAWLMAGEYEKAIVYLSQVAIRANDGEAYVRLANVYMALSHWSDAAAALNKAIEKGQLKDAGSVYLIHGMTLFRLKEFNAARQSFEMAKKFSSSKKLAAKWQQYMDNE